MNEFTSGRIAVVVEGSNRIELLDAESRENMLTDAPWLGGEEIDALREFFRAEEDERLGRWRWPENPNYVVYPDIDGYGVHNVVSESDGSMLVATPEGIKVFKDDHANAARAYFDAHPEPKPWHGAKEGELWFIDVENIQANMLAVKNGVGEIEFVSLGRRMNAQYWAIKSGRRIYPEDDS